jgi:3-deoxy-D-manno-octulosonate 8-phosphate phosphatase (KDO 8-P phosphatase)
MANARDIRIIVSDVDGVWTDGRIIYAGERSEVKEFNVRDGLGVKLAQRAGIQVVLLTSRRSPALVRRARELDITELHQGAANKLVECDQIVNTLSIGMHEVLYAGDDLPDLGPMWKLACAGGRGAFRELVERLLRERGEWDAIVDSFR